MKKCINCGKENRDENTFCSDCGGSAFETVAAPVPPVPPMPPVPPESPVPPMPSEIPAAPVPPPPQFAQPMPVPYAVHTKQEFTKFDLMTILGFVSAIVGIFYIGLILEPLAAITAIVGFIKGKRMKGLAAAGFIIAVIALLIRLFYTLYVNGVIPKWLVSGSFDM